MFRGQPRGPRILRKAPRRVKDRFRRVTKDRFRRVTRARVRQFVVSPWRPMIIKEGNVPSDDVLSEAPCRCERSDRAVGSPDFGTRRWSPTTAGHGGSAHPGPRFGRERETHARATVV